MKNFSQQFDLIYKVFCTKAQAEGLPTSKLALSRFLGVTQANMQSWEKGQTPTAKGLQLIHDKLGFSYSWLITGEGDPFAEDGGGAGAEVAALRKENEALRNELAEADRINRKLTAKLLTGDTAAQGVGGNEAAAG